MPADALHRLRRQAHAAYVIAKKDALIYYLKPPVISFGIVFPLFSYLAFAAGRSVPTEMMVPGIVAMALFFTASAIGPLVAFSAMGVLMAAPPTNAPSQIMMLSSLVRLPPIFISGVFVPHADVPQWGQWLSPLSPLSYSADLIRVGFGGAPYFPLPADIAALVGFALLFLAAARFIHRLTRDRAR